MAASIIKNELTKLESLHAEMEKERNRIVMIKKTTGLDCDFADRETKRAKKKLKELQVEFNNEYEYQNS